MFNFGPASTAQLDTVHPDLQRVVRRVLGFGVMDFSITEGHRSLDRQQELFRQGATQIDGINKKGKHNYTPSKAVDLLPYPVVLNGKNVWKDPQRFHVLAGLMFAAASLDGVEIRWGGDWDGDGNAADQTFFDLPHFELV